MYINKKLSVPKLMILSWKIQLNVLLVVSIASVTYITFLNEYLQLSGVIITVLGTAISFFIGFINSQAYGRWWESRKIWGELVNDSRSFCRMVISFIVKDGGDDDFSFFKKY